MTSTSVQDSERPVSRVKSSAVESDVPIDEAPSSSAASVEGDRPARLARGHRVRLGTSPKADADKKYDSDLPRDTVSVSKRRVAKAIRQYRWSQALKAIATLRSRGALPTEAEYRTIVVGA